MSEYEETDSLTLAVAKAIINAWHEGDVWDSLPIEDFEKYLPLALAAIKAYDLPRLRLGQTPPNQRR